MEIYSEVTMAADALKQKAMEIATSAEENGLELAKEIESNLSIRLLPGPATPASVRLADGAARVGWSSVEVPRWMEYPGAAPQDGKRRSMTKTYLPRALRAGATVLTGHRVDRLVFRDRRAVSAVVVRRDRDRAEAVPVRFDHVIVCAGAIQTPALLQRSGARGMIGRTLAIHPMVKAVARFPNEVNIPEDVPVHQVKEFSPSLSFGGSASRPGLMALALVPTWAESKPVLEDWRRCAVYYAAITTVGHGRVRAIRGLRDPLVTYSLARVDGDLPPGPGKSTRRSDRAR